MGMPEATVAAGYTRGLVDLAVAKAPIGRL
jgi:hypothetical protein